MLNRTLALLALAAICIAGVSLSTPAETASATRGHLRPFNIRGTIESVGYQDTDDHRMVVISVRVSRVRGRAPLVTVTNPRLEELFQSGRIEGGPGAVGPRSAFVTKQTFRRGQLTHLAYRCELRGEGHMCVRSESHPLPFTVGQEIALKLANSLPNDRVIVPRSPGRTGPHTERAGPTLRVVQGARVGQAMQVHVTDPEGLTTTPGPMVVPRNG